MNFYMVQPGDTLYNIALAQKVPMGKLMVDNGFPARPLLPGQALLLPHEKGEKNRPALSLWAGTEKSLTPLPLLAPEERAGRNYEKLDFEGQAARAEFVLLQTPEEYKPVSLPRLRTRLDSVLKLIPREKLVLELDCLGRNREFSSNSSRLLAGEQAEQLAAAKKASLRFAPLEQLTRFRYSDKQGREHEVKFPDLRSIDARLSLVKELGLGGVAFPHLSPAVILLLLEKFTPIHSNSGLDFGRQI